MRTKLNQGDIYETKLKSRQLSWLFSLTLPRVILKTWHMITKKFYKTKKLKN